MLPSHPVIKLEILSFVLFDYCILILSIVIASLTVVINIYKIKHSEALSKTKDIQKKCLIFIKFGTFYDLQDQVHERKY